MPLPRFYRPEKVGTLYAPDTAAAIRDGRAWNPSPAAEDRFRIVLLLVDAQVDFIHPDAALCVPGAVEDTRRTIGWILRNAEAITSIIASLDSHVPHQIFFPIWWSDQDGNHPAPFTPVTSDDVAGGRWQPRFERDWSLGYLRRLEEQAKKVLMVWPYHTLIGTPGHGITPALFEAIAYHAAARKSQPVFVHKGTLAKTEFYSVLEPEVPVPGDPQGSLNEALLDELLRYDRVYVAGQAKSHCVLETVASILRHRGDRPGVAGKIHLLSDCTSSVSHPDVDFDAMAEESYARCRSQGMKLVRSSDPVSS